MRISKVKLISLLSVFATTLIAIAGFVWLARVSAMPTNNFFGAIFTSLGDGTAVNQNLYDSKSDVYLNGGPQNMNASGLPNGTYYFQVTDPSGATLLSTDAASCRQLTVANGVVSGAAPAAGACAHANGAFNPNNGSTPVQLAPFNDTPNNGGEYKVWLIRQTSETSVNSGDPRVINFKSKDAKTDNFKVKREECVDCDPPPTVTLSGHKFYDANANAVDNNEAPVANILIKIVFTPPGGMEMTVYVPTDGSGNWAYSVPTGSTYTVSEVVPCVDDNNDMMCDPYPK